MNQTTQVVLSVATRGDILEIVPIDKFPNAERILNVWEVTENGVLYNVTERCDGYVIPLCWIKSAKIIGRWM